MLVKPKSEHILAYSLEETQKEYENAWSQLKKELNELNLKVPLQVLCSGVAGLAFEYGYLQRKNEEK